MIMRTLQFYGQGYGSSPVSIIATIDNVQAFSGEINTIEAPVPTINTTYAGQILFTYEISSMFGGTKEITITCGPEGFLKSCGAKYNYVEDPAPNFILNAEEQALVDSPRPYTQAVHDRMDALRAVKGPRFTNYGPNDYRWPVPTPTCRINNILQEVPPGDPLTGQWHWTVPAGATLSYSLNILPAIGLKGNY